jgi:hypothetical protein
LDALVGTPHAIRCRFAFRSDTYAGVILYSRLAGVDTLSFLFFTSYARDNRASATDEDYLRKFVSELENEIRQLGPPRTNEIAFLDTESIEGGEIWPVALADALRTSRLCVCLYSSSYFNSKWCGKEFRAFCDRRDAWMAKPANRGKRPQVLFPVIWIRPREVPAIVQDVQYTHDDYPKSYRELGLRQLMRLTRYQDDYNEFLGTLAQKIVDAAHTIRWRISRHCRR